MMSNEQAFQLPSLQSQPMVYSHSAPNLGTYEPSRIGSYSLDANSQLRFEMCLEAPTASAQRMEEVPMTYLNKGQYYQFSLKDRKGEGVDLLSTFTITFHDPHHRQSAKDYWKFWLTHQEVHEARAVELDSARSAGVDTLGLSSTFDSIRFRWHGALGAQLYLRFNCLSTDFSRIKGVKGIPLRLQIETQPWMSSALGIEKTCCKIKLFRDKGAERKNKDDAKHIERQLERLREKEEPGWLAYAPAFPVTLFKEPPLPEQGLKRTALSLHPSSPKRRIQKRCLLIRFEPNEIYRAIYLDALTVQDLKEKILQKAQLGKPVTGLVCKSRQKQTLVSMKDDVVQNMVDSQDLTIQIQENPDHASLTLFLIF